MGGRNFEGEARLYEEFAAARRCGSKDESGHVAISA
jgi:hypothetical protein